MQGVPLGPKRVKLSQIKDYKNNGQYVQHQVNNQRAETLQKQKIKNGNMKIKHTLLLQMNLQMLYRRGKIQKKLSWNNLFINQTHLLGTELL